MELYVQDYLDKNNIQYKLHKHPAVFTVAESSAIIGDKITGLRTKSLFLKDEKENYYLITLSGQKRLDIKELKAHFKVKELHFSSKEEMKREIKATPGSVSILCMLNASDKVKLIVEIEVNKADIVVFHPNINTESLEVTHENFIKLYNSLKCKKEIIKI